MAQKETPISESSISRAKNGIYSCRIGPSPIFRSADGRYNRRLGHFVQEVASMMRVTASVRSVWDPSARNIWSFSAFFRWNSYVRGSTWAP
jgi:hypothetical protein